MYVAFEKISQVELEVEQNVLSSKVDLTDGSTGHIFSRNPCRNDARLFTYNCHICSVPNLPGERCLYTHISGRRHQQRLATQPFNANLFRAPLHRSNKSTLLMLFYNRNQNSFCIFFFTMHLYHHVCTYVSVIYRQFFF